MQYVKSVLSLYPNVRNKYKHIIQRKYHKMNKAQFTAPTRRTNPHDKYGKQYRERMEIHVKWLKEEYLRLYDKGFSPKYIMAELIKHTGKSKVTIYERIGGVRELVAKHEESKKK